MNRGTNRMSRSNRVKPAGVNNAHNEDKMFAEQGPNLKALKLVCVGLGVSTIIITAVFGGLIYHLMGRMDIYGHMTETNRASIQENTDKLDNLESDLMKLNPNETSNTVGLQNISMKVNVLEEDLNAYIPVVQENSKRLSEVLQLETNTSHLSELQSISKKIAALYSVRLEDRALLNEIDTALSKLDTNVNAHIQIVQNNSDTLQTLEMGILQLEGNQTQNKMNLHDMSKWINETESNFAVHVATIQENSNKLSNVEDKLTEETDVLRNLSLEISIKNEEHSNDISQLESDMGTLFQNQTSRIAQLELDKTANDIVIQLHGDKMEDLERNLTSAYSVITTNTGNILANSDNLRRVENITSTQHANLLLHADRLTQLESFRADDQNTTQAHESRITALEIIKIKIKDTLQNHSSRLDALESEPALDRGTMVNQTLRLELLETNMHDLNMSLQNEISIIEDLDARVVQLQLDTNTALQDHSDKLTKLTDYKSAFTAYGIVPTEGFYGNIVMGGVTTDIGGHYEAFTGQFTCQYSGVYVFTVNLYSKTSAYCYIRKNTQNQVYAEVEALVDVFAESSSSVVLQLMRGDKVDVGDCFAANRLASFTSFTGFLLYPDLL